MEIASPEEAELPTEESQIPTPIVIVVTATPEPTPIVIVVTATPEPTVIPTATSTPEPPVPGRADVLHGEGGAYCKRGIRFSLRVLSASEVRRDIIGIVVEVTNLDSRSEDIFRMFDLRDERSRTFDMTGTSEYPQYVDDLRLLRGQGVISNLTNIQPGRTEQVYTAFLVASDSTSFRLAQRRPPCA